MQTIFTVVARQLLLFMLLLLSTTMPLWGQSRVERVSYTHTELSSQVSKQLYLNTSEELSTCHPRTINKASLLAKLDLGEELSLDGNTFSSTVPLKLVASDGNGVTLFTVSRSLSISPNAPEQLLSYDFSTHHSKVKRIDVVIEAGYQSSAEVSSKLRLEVFYKEAFYQDMSQVNVTPAALSLVDGQFEQTFSWSASCPNVAGYQLQVLRLYKSNDPSLLPEQDWAKALTVEVEGNKTSYKLALVEGSGDYKWRIRALGFMPGGVGNPVNWGPWSAVQSLTYAQPEEQLNWIYSRSFAEQGRMAEQMSYGNGLQQLAQTQIRQQSNQQVVAAQSLQDFSGRAAWQSLPVPVAGKQKLGYVAQLFKSQQADGTSRLYAAPDFDAGEKVYAPSPATEVDYYSSTSTGNNDRVADAEGYAYVRTLFTNDGTGRVKEQSSPGKQHSIGTNHTTRTYYSGVSAAELVRVFGKEAPEARSAHKVISLDANGTGSVNYIAKDGKTIATALVSGANGAGLEGLSSEVGSSTKVVDLVIESSPYNGIGSISTKPLYLSSPTSLRIQYKLTAQAVSALCGSSQYCASCDYFVEILVRNQETDAVVSRITRSVPAGSACTAAPVVEGFPIDESTTTLAPGNYVVEKHLTSYNTNELGQPYLVLHQDKIKEQFEAEQQAGDWQQIHSYLNSNDHKGLYSFLLGKYELYNEKGEQVWALPQESSASGEYYFQVGLGDGCGQEQVRIPVLTDDCRQEVCDSVATDYAAYLIKVLKETAPAVDEAGNALPEETGLDAAGNLKYVWVELVPNQSPREQLGYSPEEFNQMLRKMVEEGYPCQQVWSSWKEQVDNLKVLRGSEQELKDLLQAEYSGSGQQVSYETDLLGNFFMAVEAQKKTFFTVNSTEAKQQAKLEAYKTFYYDGSDSKKACMLQYLSEGSISTQSFAGLSAVEREEIYSCIRYGGAQLTEAETEQQVAAYENKVEGNCRTTCQDRREEFKQSLIDAYHNNDQYVEGDQYALIYDEQFKKKTATGLPYTPTTVVAMCQIEEMADELVKTCQGDCNLTVVKDANNKITRVGTEQELERMQQAMNGRLEVNLNSTATGFTAIQGVAAGSFKFDFAHTVLGNVSMLDMIVDQEFNTYVLGYTSDQPGDIVTPKGRFAKLSTIDLVLAKFDKQGELLWLRQVGGMYNIEEAQAARLKDDNQGDIIVTGRYRNALQFTTGAALQTMEAAQSYYILKYSASGDLLFKRNTVEFNIQSFTSEETGNRMAVATDQWGNIYMWAGNFAAGIDYESSVLFKLNGVGSLIWKREIKSLTDGGRLINIALGISSYDSRVLLSISPRGTKTTWTTISFEKEDGTWYNDTSSHFEVYSYSIDGTNFRNIYFNGGGATDRVYGLDVDNKDGNIYSSHLNDIDNYSIEKLINKDVTRLDHKVIGSYIYKHTHGTKLFFREDGNIDLFVEDGSNPHQLLRILINVSDGTYSSKALLNLGSLLKAYDLEHKENTYILSGIAKSGAELGGNSLQMLSTTGDAYNTFLSRYQESCGFPAFSYRWSGGTAGTVTEVKPAAGFEDYVNRMEPLSCDQVTTAAIRSSIEGQLEEKLQARLATFSQNYKTSCAGAESVTDELSIEYALGYHHYTLYYHDRAGNLVRTVPPAGVVALDVSTLDKYLLAKDQATSHQLITSYEYNSLQQLVKQQTPDGGESRFYYNALGQLRFSQNAVQQQAGRYSYTKYDNLGRVTEVGESSEEAATFTSQVNNTVFPAQGIQKTVTVYSTPADISYLDGRRQHHLLNRVSYSYVEPGADASERSYTYYSYDVHGNVEWLCQQVPGLGRSYVRYEYELISGKVLEVVYNEWREDELRHRYSYDDDNRITAVYTSKDGLLWDRDGSYSYYAHGPLQRAELGEDKVQGVDYTYTIQGWLKAINHPSLDPGKDPGGDGVAGKAAKDAFGMALGYYQGDYKGQQAGVASSLNAEDNSTLPAIAGKDLYNGNISTWTSQTMGSKEAGKKYEQLTGERYSYDALNRIKSSSFMVHSNGSWSPTDEYGTSYSYDGNGNLKTLNRNGTTEAGLAMDALEYEYYPATNKLKRVKDAVLAGAYEDIKDQVDAENYVYDQIGNLIEDKAERVKISWNVYGKISKVEKRDANDALLSTQSYLYDTQGNRVVKKEVTATYSRSSYYVRDAQGNILSVYQRHEQDQANNLILQEQPIYGSDRIGVHQPNLTITAQSWDVSGELVTENLVVERYANRSYNVEQSYSITLGDGFEYMPGEGQEFYIRFAGAEPVLATRKLQDKVYELKDHLGNVRATVSDVKLHTNNVFSPELKSYTHYYAFGMQMPSRSYSTGLIYRYGYNGKELDKEGMGGGGSTYDYGFRIYNPQIARFLSVDPLSESFPYFSPYQFAGLDPIKYIDLDGLERAYIDPGSGMVIPASDFFQHTPPPGSVYVTPLPSKEKQNQAWEDLNTIGSFLPVLGDGIDAKDAYNDFSAGNYGMATLSTLSLIPGADFITKPIKLSLKNAKHVMDASGAWGKTAYAYRRNLQIATGKLANGYDAHHTLPKSKDFKAFFEKAGLDVNDPANMVWREMNDHRGKKSSEHTKLWDMFMQKNPNATKEQILQQRDIIEKKVWGNTTGDVPTN
jgi:RHS repeat-associated protein